MGQDQTEFLYTLFDSFNQVILPLGVLSTSLLLPFEDYVADINNNVNNQSSSQNGSSVETARSFGKRDMSTSYNVMDNQYQNSTHTHRAITREYYQVSLELETVVKDEKTPLITDSEDNEKYDSFRGTV